MEHTIYVTHENGDTAKVTGPEAVVDLVRSALLAIGARYESEPDCYDFGFYRRRNKARD